MHKMLILSVLLNTALGSSYLSFSETDKQDWQHRSREQGRGEI